MEPLRQLSEIGAVRIAQSRLGEGSVQFGFGIKKDQPRIAAVIHCAVIVVAPYRWNGQRSHQIDDLVGPLSVDDQIPQADETVGSEGFEGSEHPHQRLVIGVNVCEDTESHQPAIS